MDSLHDQVQLCILRVYFEGFSPSLSLLTTLQLRPIHHSGSVELTWFSCNEDSGWFTLGALELWVPCPTS